MVRKSRMSLKPLSGRPAPVGFVHLGDDDAVEVECICIMFHGDKEKTGFFSEWASPIEAVVTADERRKLDAAITQVCEVLAPVFARASREMARTMSGDGSDLN